MLDKDFPLTQLFLSTSSHDPNQAPHVLLLGTTSKQSTVLEVNAHTGGIKSVDYIDGKLEKVTAFSVTHSLIFKPQTP